MKPLAPIENIFNQAGIVEYLTKRVHGQETSINTLSAVLSSMMLHARDDKPQTHFIRKVTLAGVNSSGKMKTVDAVTNLLGMKQGYPHRRQLIHIKGDDVSGKEYRWKDKEGRSLLERLRKAANTKKNEDTDRPLSMSCICLVLEDFDKASAAFMESVGSLLEEGYYKIPDKGEFQLKRRTPFLVMFTTSCIAIDVSLMRKRDDLMVGSIVRRVIHQRWPVSNVTKHLGQILAYYPLHNKALKPLLLKAFENYMETSTTAKRCGSKPLKCPLNVKEMMVDHVLARATSTENGIVGSIDQLCCKLELFFSTGANQYDAIKTKAKKEKNHQQQFQSLVISAQSIDTERFAESLDSHVEHVLDELTEQNSLTLLKTTDVMNSIQLNTDNDQIMSECDPSQEGKVNAVTMAYGDKPLCSVVCNIIYNNYHIVNNADQRKEVKHLKQKLHSYKKTLKEVIQTIDRSCERSSFNKQMKKIADSKRDLICSSSDEEEEDEYENIEGVNRTNKRHAICAPAEDTPTKRPRLDLSCAVNFTREIDIYVRGKEHAYEELFESGELSEEASDYQLNTYAEEKLCKEIGIEIETEEEDKEGKKNARKEENQELSRKCKGPCGLIKSMGTFKKMRKRPNGTRYETSVLVCNTCRKQKK